MSRLEDTNPVVVLKNVHGRSYRAVAVQPPPGCAYRHEKRQGSNRRPQSRKEEQGRGSSSSAHEPAAWDETELDADVNQGHAEEESFESRLQKLVVRLCLVHALN